MSLTTEPKQRNVLRPAPDLSQAFQPRRRRRRWWLLLVILAALGWLAPGIVAHTPLLGWLLATATNDFDATVTVRKASLGWLSPIRLQQIEVRDAQDQSILQVEQFDSEHSLAAILWDYAQPGPVRLQRPKLNLVLRQDGSNLEDLITESAEPSSAGPSPRIDVQLEIVDGTITITDQASGQTQTLEQVNLSLHMPGNETESLRLELSAMVADRQQPGRLTAKLDMRPPGDGQTLGLAGKLALTADAVPLELLGPILARFQPETRVAGRLTSTVDVQWDSMPKQPTTSVQTSVTVDDFTLAMPQLGADQIRLRRLEATGQIARQGQRFNIQQGSVTCDLGNFAVTGTVDLGQRGPGAESPSMLHQTLQVDGQLDLARLAAMLPETLHIRRETQITSGQVRLAYQSRPESRGMVWRGHLEASQVTAQHQGRQLTWQRPVLVTLSAYESPDGPIIEDFKCESDFLKLHATGTPFNLAASASFDLNRLVDQLGQFVDFGQLRMAGDGWTHLNWKRAADGRFETDAELQLRNFQLALPEKPPWTEEHLLVFLSAGGQTDLGLDTQLDKADLQIQTPTERLDARLTQPVLDLTGGGTWPVQIHMTGQFQRWLQRIEPFMAIEDYKLGGGYDLNLVATGSVDGVTIRHAKLALDQFSLNTPQVNIAEPNLQLELTGGWDRRQRRWQVDSAVLTSESLAIQADHLLLAMPEDEPLELNGALTYRADLQTLIRWFADPNEEPTWQITGNLDGSAEIGHADEAITWKLDADILELMMAATGGKAIREPAARLVVSGDYRHDSQTVRMQHIQLRCGTVAADAEGQITWAGEQAQMQFAGRARYDLPKLAELLRPYVGPGVRMTGTGESIFSWEGPFELAKTTGQGSLTWQQADIYGFQVEPGQLHASLADGLLQTRPLDVAVNGGRVRLAPRLDLAAEPVLLTLPAGPIAEQVRITPQMCDNGLKYIAPALAGITAAEGSFSIELDGCHVPIGDWAKCELAGKFVVHGIRIGPGPLTQELAVLMGHASPAELRRESAIKFQMVDGRVYHENMELLFPDLTVRTYGSVGLDQTLALMTEMPIPQKWIGNNPLGTALQGKTIRLPIAGTLTRPRLDQRELERLSGQFIQDAAQGVLQKEVGRQLERLFGPPPQN